MKKLKKSFLLAFIAPVVMAGCQMTPAQPPVHEHNAIVKAQLTPLSDHYKGYELIGCNNKIDINNYEKVMESRISGTYGSPLSKSCIPISFNESEPEEFYQDIISKAKDPEAAKELVGILKKGGYSDNMDGMHIHKIGLDDGRVAQVMRFNDGKTFSKLKGMWNDRDEMLAFIDEYVFLHELFHTSAMNLDKSLPKNIREGLSDVSTVLTLSTKHKLTLEQTADLAQDVYWGREGEASNNPTGRAYEGSHFNKTILRDMIGYLEELQDRGGEVQRFASLKEANEFAMDIVLDLDYIERSTFAIGDVYWERGMEVNDEEVDVPSNDRKSFNEILSIAKATVQNVVHKAHVNKSHEVKDEDGQNFGM
jgi:hypothetical protein